MAVPSWMRAGTGGPAIATRGLQHHELGGVLQGEGRRVETAVKHPAPRGVQQEGGPTTAATHPAAVPPPEGCEQQTTPLVRMSTRTASPDLEPGGLRQQATGRSPPREGRAGPPFHSIIGVKRGPPESGDGPSMRPRSHPKQRSPGPSDGSNAASSLSPLLGIFRRRRRAAYPPPGAPKHVQQRLKVPFAKDTQSQASPALYGETTAFRVHRPGCVHYFG